MDNNYDKLKENLKKEILEELREDEPEVAGEDYEPLKLSHGQKSVSYTHLTLPTICSV